MLIRYGDALLNLDHVVRAVYCDIPAPLLTVDMADGKSHTIKTGEAVAAWHSLRRHAEPSPIVPDDLRQEVAALGRRVEMLEQETADADAFDALERRVASLETEAVELRASIKDLSAGVRSLDDRTVGSKRVGPGCVVSPLPVPPKPETSCQVGYPSDFRCDRCGAKTLAFPDHFRCFGCGNSMPTEADAARVATCPECGRRVRPSASGAYRCGHCGTCGVHPPWPGASEPDGSKDRADIAPVPAAQPACPMCGGTDLESNRDDNMAWCRPCGAVWRRDELVTERRP